MISFERIGYTTSSAMAENMVVATEGEWVDFWRSMGQSDSALPDIDFAKKKVVVISQGVCSCDSFLYVTNVQRIAHDVLKIEYHEVNKYLVRAGGGIVKQFITIDQGVFCSKIELSRGKTLRFSDLDHEFKQIIDGLDSPDWEGKNPAIAARESEVIAQLFGASFNFCPRPRRYYDDW